MTMQRRTLLQGMTGMALLAPWLALERAMAQAVPHREPTQQEMMDAHMQSMNRVLGPGLYRTEKIAMLLYPGFTALDLVGPHYFFACLFGAQVQLVTTETDLAPVKSDLGLAIAPTALMSDVPNDLDVIFVPGGTTGTLNIMQRQDVMNWLADRGARARHVTSVCTGSMALGKAGLLIDKRATSHWATRAVLADFGAIPVDARVVTDGRVTTGAGVSAGIDYALALVEMLRGRPYAEGLMLQAEYHPEPPFKGGTVATTTADVGEMMSQMFAPVAEQFRALARPTA